MRRRAVKKREVMESVQEESESDTSLEDTSSEHEEFCFVCKKLGELLCCDDCTLVFHLKCLTPKLSKIPKGKWICPVCVERKGKEQQKTSMSTSGADSDSDILHSGRITQKRRLPPREQKPKRQKVSYAEESENESSDEEEETSDSDSSMDESPERDSDGNILPDEEIGEGYLRFPFLNSKKKIKRSFGSVHIDKILTWMAKNATQEAKMYLVKIERFPYRRCVWLPRVLLFDIATQKLRNFERNQTPSCEEIDENVFPLSYLEVDHVTAKKGRTTKYFTLWKGLPYDEGTWEEASSLDPKLIESFETQNSLEECDRKLKTMRKRGKKRFTNLSKQPAFINTGELKEYQLQGVSWLLSSWQKPTNVILADEMGLGKTVQSIAFLAMLHRFRSRGPFLIVVPVSTLNNWEREFEKWAPQINVLKYYGSQEARRMMKENEFFFKAKDQPKSIKERLLKCEVVLTSYSMIIADEASLKRFKWDVLIVDEAQRLKNKDSKLFQCLQSFDIDFKLLLTGTPLQNTMQELYVLLHFLDPELFHSESDFLSQFDDGIVTGESHIKKLHQLLAPHMLRRVKADVLEGLPGKEEFIVRVEMSELQLQYYRAILTKNYSVLCGAGSNRTKVSLSNIVMELQKCCNHPFLFPGAESQTESPKEACALLIQSSGKMVLLDNLLTQLKARGHRVLLFSQMTRMLDILEDYMFYKGYGYERIDGSITGSDRQERIDRFNAKTSTHFCFLLSTRAGGLGINLATADTVVIYDSDWNPHNDIQALSRAHRIGQENHVMIYRMVTRSSVEESIVQRAKKKMMIEHLVVEKMGSKGETKLKKGELDDILRFGSEQLFKDNPPGESSGDIIYDEEAINRLLARDGSAKEDSENQYLNSFRVADYDVIEDESAPPKEDDDYWEKLLSSRRDKIERESEEQLGKGKRTRNQPINYYGSSQSRKIQLPTSPAHSSGSENEREEGLDEFQGNSSSLSISLPYMRNFSPNQRASFFKVLMMHGIQPSFWNSLRDEKFGFLRTKSTQDLEDYSRAILLYLLEETNDNRSGKMDAYLRESGLATKQILGRLVSMYLIHKKIQCTEVEFDIKENGWTPLKVLWNDKENVWKRKHDYAFLVGISRHGYGKWSDIMVDKELDLQATAFLATGRKPRSVSFTPSSCNLAMPQIHGNTYSSVVVDESGSHEKSTKYKPDKIVSRFLRSRLQLLESALTVEFQIYSNVLNLDSVFDHLKPDATHTTPPLCNDVIEINDDADVIMAEASVAEAALLELAIEAQQENIDGKKSAISPALYTLSDFPVCSSITEKSKSSEKTLSTTAPSSVGEEEKKKEGEGKEEMDMQEGKDPSTETKKEEPITPSIISLLSQSLEKPLEVKNFARTKRVLAQKTNESAISLSNSCTSLFAASGDTQTKEDMSARIDFLNSFGEMYDMALHMKEQLVRFYKEVHPEIRDEARQEHFKSLQALDSLVGEAKFSLKNTEK